MKVGSKVRVVKDFEDPEGNTWVGSIGVIAKIAKYYTVVQFTEDQIPEDAKDGSNQAWFNFGELEEV